MVQNWAAVAVKLQSREETYQCGTKLLYSFLSNPMTWSPQRTSFCWPWWRWRTSSCCCLNQSRADSLFCFFMLLSAVFNFTGFAHIGTLRFDVFGVDLAAGVLIEAGLMHALTLSGVTFPASGSSWILNETRYHYFSLSEFVSQSSFLTSQQYFYIRVTAGSTDNTPVIGSPLHLVLSVLMFNSQIWFCFGNGMGLTYSESKYR